MYERTEKLIGAENVSKLKSCHVAVFGLGGVGSYTVEALARAGVGELTIVDHDIIAESNLNRQLIALNSTIGLYKVDVCKRRVMDINPKAVVNAVRLFYTPANSGCIDWNFDYAADAVDNITAKIHIIETARLNGIRAISCMGTGNKINPSAFKVADIFETSVCPLARVMRRELRKRGIPSLKTVFSDEMPQTRENIEKSWLKSGSRPSPASISFVPSTAGLIIAAEIIADIIGNG